MDNALIETSSINWAHTVNGRNSGNTEWAEATAFGTDDFFFFEDIVGVGNSNEGALLDCHSGGKFVVRHSDFTKMAVGQTHPTGHAWDDRGCRAHEIYGNTTHPSGASGGEPNFAFDYYNSGPGMTWGNSVDNTYKNIMYFNNCRSNDAANCGYSQSSPPNGWGYCNSGGGSAWDGPQIGECIDQPGRGAGDTLSGTFPNKINTRTGTIAWPRQALEPVYEWLNTGNPVSGWGGSWFSNRASSSIIAQNRDFYLHHGNTSCDPGAGTCSAGVGVGTRAQRPANCTTGVAWWSTDQGGNWHKTNGTSNDGTLDVCSATNTWSDGHYTPYTYPHPLRAASATPPPTDSTPATVSLTAPTSGTTVSGTITVSANASDNVGVVGVQFKLDGANLGAEDTTNAYSAVWNTTGVANGTYTLTAVARDAAGNVTTSAPRTVTVSNSSPSDTTAPATPTNLTVSSASATQINVSWSASTDNVGVTGYRLERCSGSDCTSFSQIATPNSTSYSNTGLSAGTTYRYRVRAIDAAGNLSSYSSVASATTQPQTTGGEETIWGSRSTTKFAGDDQAWDLGLIFTPTTDGQVTGVRVYGAPEETGAHTARLWRNSDGALLSGPHTFTYSGIGWHDFSLPTPVSLSANQTYTVTVSTGEDAAGWYTVEAQDPDMGTGGDNGLHIAYPPNAAVYSETIGERPTQSWQQSNYLRDVIFVAESATADTAAPSVPVNPQATAVSTSQIDLTWTVSTDDVGVSGYQVERCAGASCTDFVQIATPGGTSYSDTRLAANTTYRYRIRATDAAGNLSSYSDVASATTPAEPPREATDDNVYYPLEAAARADGDWTPVDAPSGFAEPVVLAGPPSFNDADPGVVRLNNVDDRGFELRFQEWDYRQRLGDMFHALESIPYLVLEPGRHVMSDGSIWEVGTFSLGGTKSWRSVGFTEPFDNAPYLFLTVQTANDPEAVTVRARSVGAAGFQAALFEEEALMNGHGVETVGYLAIESYDGGGAIDIEGDQVSYMLQSVSADEQWTPVLNQWLKVEEEQSKGNEVKHTDETLHVLAIGQRLFAQQVSNNGGDTTAPRRLPPGEDASM